MIIDALIVGSRTLKGHRQMSKYCITAARPQNATHHLNSEFKLWKWEKKVDDTWTWIPKSWKRTAEIVELLDNGNEVLTARENEKTITTGASVEIELRIAKNQSRFKITEMPDK